MSSASSPLPSDSDVLVRVSGVSKKFCLSLKKSLWYGLCDMGRELTGRRHGEAHVEVRGSRSEGRGPTAGGPTTNDQQPTTILPTHHPPSTINQEPGLRPKEFWAVHDVSFELKRGECLGLIGRNGAGKTTLLKMLNGLIKPDAGRIEMRGRVGALISLGAGFNPILTGRENIYINASVLGLSKKEIDAKLEEIIDFAEIGDFMDTPVQNYSSGMAVRLGFAVASSFEPDILLLDEVLAVGDEGFRHKCYSRIQNTMQNCAVIFVTHNMDYVGHICTSAMCMFKGAGIQYPTTADAIGAYRADNVSAPDPVKNAGLRAFYPPIQHVEVSLVQARVAYGEDLRLVVEVESAEALPEMTMGVYVRNKAEQQVLTWHTSQFDRTFDLPAGKTRLTIPIGPILLQGGEYLVSFFLTRLGQIEHLVWFWNQVPLTVVNPAPPIGNVPCIMPFRGLDMTQLGPAVRPAGDLH